MRPLGSSNLMRPCSKIVHRSIGLFVGLSLVLVGCAAPSSWSSSPEPEPLPKLRDVMAARTPAGSLPPPPSAVAKAMRLEVYRLEIAADADLLALRQLAKRGTIAMPDRDLWRANGFLVGTLGPKELGEFERMPLPILARGQTMISASQPWNVLSVYPPPSSSFSPVIELFGSDGRSRPVTLTAGRRQFLFSLLPSGFQAGVLTLVPHLHQREFSFTPRLSSEAELDGRRFDELAMKVYLPAGHRLLLMPDASALAASGLSLWSDQENDSTSQPSHPSASDEKVDAANHAMGRFWLTGQVQGRASQAVLLIRLLPPP